jgi:phosphoglycerol transferase MdoB-like AlkP superfamily enzyme
MKDSFYRMAFSRLILFIYFTLITFLLLMNSCSEIAFWDEFSVRYNFIAVDYLIYTQEVIGNIWESYNIPLIMGSVFIVGVIIVFLLRKPILASCKDSMRFGERSLFLFAFVFITLAGYVTLNNQLKNIGDNKYVNELGGNGIFEFGSAFWHNEINYPDFYLTRPDSLSFRILRDRLSGNGVSWDPSLLSVSRSIRCDSPFRKWNVILISVESLSGSFLRYFGSDQNITPVLDSLIPHGLFFSNMYASGTRTVRGLEALSLAIPPTPGQSVVRRPHNENLGSMGSVLGAHGYDVRYIYGGNSFFDNMGYFFSHNGYRVIDRRDFAEKDIHHETAWGVADEDAFSMTLKACNESYAKGRPFFNHIMTTSNHRPYTYPEGRIDIPPSRQVREGAVKYTDYAMGRFVEECSRQPWFANTLFVIVADHCAKSAGKVALPYKEFHIPCLMFNPSLVKPAIYSGLASQIDLVPTILGMMNTPYQSEFLGYDLFRMKPGIARSFISTYESMGFMKADTLVVLSPRARVSVYQISSSGDYIPVQANPPLLDEAIAWFQGTYSVVRAKQQRNAK